MYPQSTSRPIRTAILTLICVFLVLLLWEATDSLCEGAELGLGEWDCGELEGMGCVVKKGGGGWT